MIEDKYSTMEKKSKLYGYQVGKRYLPEGEALKMIPVSTLLVKGSEQRNEAEPVVPLDIPGAITANPKTITRDLRDLATLSKPADARKEIEVFVRDWNKERGTKEGKIVAQFIVGLLNRLAGK